MNKKRGQQEKLLAEAFHDDWAEGPAAGFARAAAAQARRRHRVRRTLLASATATAMAAALSIAIHRQPTPAKEISAVGKPPVGYEVISDDELIARVHDQPLLILPEDNGTKKIVLLGE